MQKSFVFPYANNKLSEREIKNNPTYNHVKKNKIHRDKSKEVKNPVLRKLQNDDESN